MLRVGVTGHRSFADPVEVGRALDGVLDGVLDDQRPVSVGEPPRVEVWSSLAEGADRLVVGRLRERAEARLIAVLPLDATDYRDDFADRASCAEFDELLATAAEVRVTGPDASGSRTSAYARAGRAVADAADVLVALWDGELARGEGDTAEIVDHALRVGRDVRIIPARRPDRPGDRSPRRS